MPVLQYHGAIVLACVGLLLLLLGPCGRGCPGSRLVGRIICSLLGYLPGAGLLLLTVRDAVLILIHGLLPRHVEEEQPLLDFVSVVATLQSLNELLEAPSESRKIRGFRAALEDDD